MHGVTHRRFARYPSTVPVNPLPGDESLYNDLRELEQIYELLPNGLATLDRKLHFLRINTAFSEWVGLSSTDIIGRSLFEIFPDGAAILSPLMHHVIRKGAPACSAIFAGPGIPEERRLTYFPLRDKKNQIQGVLMRVDKTRRKKPRGGQRNEEYYRNHLAHLQRVSTIGELASSLAHELNQPLTAILSNAQAALRYLASRTPSLEDVREILQDIVSDDQRAGEVIRRLRGLLRKSELDHKALSVNEVVEDVYRILRSDAVARRCTIQRELAPELPLVHGDPVQLQQVLLNLMLNGLEAMSDESPARRTLTVSTRRMTAELLQISVRDGGCGLDRENTDQVFEPFYTTKQDGLGMGLAIARSIIHSHGGRLWAESNTDRGATFHVTLPVRGAA